MSQLTLTELERHLWGSADLLRGSIDSGDFKHYIFGLLFYKQLCDVWEEEYEERLAEYKDSALAADPEEHRFDVPKKPRVGREATRGLGPMIADMRALAVC